MNNTNKKDAGLKARFVLLLTALFILVPFSLGFAGNKEENPAPSPPVAPVTGEAMENKFELKRENTNRGQTGESTKSIFRFEHYMSGPVSLLRIDIPLVDKNKSFGGDLTNFGLGDIKLRAGLQKIPVSGSEIGLFAEATFPTASPKDLGSGVYQFAPGLKLTVPVYPGQNISSAHYITFSTELQQYLSLAGVEGFKDINYTKFEFSLKDMWKKRYWATLTLKTNVDWVQDGKAGAVAELEIGLIINRRWSAYMKLGHSLGSIDSVAGTYQTRLTSDLAFRF